MTRTIYTVKSATIIAILLLCLCGTALAQDTEAKDPYDYSTTEVKVTKEDLGETSYFDLESLNKTVERLKKVKDGLYIIFGILFSSNEEKEKRVEYDNVKVIPLAPKQPHTPVFDRNVLSCRCLEELQSDNPCAPCYSGPLSCFDELLKNYDHESLSAIVNSVEETEDYDLFKQLIPAPPAPPKERFLPLFYDENDYPDNYLRSLKSTEETEVEVEDIQLPDIKELVKGQKLLTPESLDENELNKIIKLGIIEPVRCPCGYNPFWNHFRRPIFPRYPRMPIRLPEKSEPPRL